MCKSCGTVCNSPVKWDCKLELNELKDERKLVKLFSTESFQTSMLEQRLALGKHICK